MAIYAMSDIHGQETPFLEALSLVNFSDPDTMLVLCGDYIDRHWQHPEWFDRIHQLQIDYPRQVIVLKGNHEDAYLEANGGTLDRETRQWLRQLPLFYETDSQIFVHAGIDEEAGEFWRVGCEDWYFHSKTPPSFGPWPKDIIAGHNGTFSLCGENRVFWDGEAHFYLDGSTEHSGLVPVLKYEPSTQCYSSFRREEDAGGRVTWHEYTVRPGAR